MGGGGNNLARCGRLCTCSGAGGRRDGGVVVVTTVVLVSTMRSVVVVLVVCWYKKLRSNDSGEVKHAAGHAVRKLFDSVQSSGGGSMAAGLFFMQV